MVQIVVDPELGKKLNERGEPVELCDSAGRVLGRYTPAFNKSLYEGLEPQISEEELYRRESSGDPTYTTAEVLQHLRKLA